MSLRAPLRVPVELKRGSRWFRLAQAVSVGGLDLGQAVSDEIEGPLEVVFHLPGATAPVRCHGEVIEQVVAADWATGEPERAERRAVRFLDLDEDGAARIQAYVQERLGLT